MDIQQARDKLAGISGFTHNRHHKVLIGELCEIVKFLLDEIDRIKIPRMSVLKQTPYSLHPPLPCQPPWSNKPPPGDKPGFMPLKKSPSIIPPHPHRKGNAGDAE